VSRTIVRSASVGGAAASPIDSSIRVAPMRDVTYVVAAELRAARAPSDPWDPWLPQRTGYDSPAPASLFLPPQFVMNRLRTYLISAVR
jgi:hypothetical protein